MRDKNIVAHVSFEFGKAQVGGLGIFVNSIVNYQKTSRIAEPLVIMPNSNYKVEKAVQEIQYSDFSVIKTIEQGIALYLISSERYDSTVYPYDRDAFVAKVNHFGVRLGEVLESMDVDIVHFHDFFGFKALYAISKKRNTKTIYTIHSFHRWDPNAISSEFLMVKTVDHVVPVSTGYYLSNLDLISLNENVTVIPNGIDLDFWAAEPERDSIEESLLGKVEDFCDPTSRVFGFVGRLNDRQKGYQLILDLVATGFFSNHNKILIIGQGDASLEQATHEMAGTNILFINEFVNQNQLKYLYSKIECLIIPSRSEPFGLILVEAMASGVIPITSNVDGLAENNKDISDGGFGMVMETHSATSLLKSVERFLAIPKSDIPELQLKAKLSAEMHDQTVCFRRYDTLYQEIL